MKTAVFHVEHPGEIGAGIFPYSDEIKVSIGNVSEEFLEAMKQFITEWYDGAVVVSHSEWIKSITQAEGIKWPSAQQWYDLSHMVDFIIADIKQRDSARFTDLSSLRELSRICFNNGKTTGLSDEEED